MATLTNAEMQRNMELWYFSQVHDPTNYDLPVGSPLAELIASAEPQPDIITEGGTIVPS